MYSTLLALLSTLLFSGMPAAQSLGTNAIRGSVELGINDWDVADAHADAAGTGWRWDPRPRGPGGVGSLAPDADRLELFTLQLRERIKLYQRERTGDQQIPSELLEELRQLGYVR